MNGVFKALSDPTRRRVLQLLRDCPMTAGELADHFDVSKPTMSAHFSVLQQAGLVDAERDGRSIVYRLKMSVLEDALLGFAHTLGWNVTTAHDARAPRATTLPPKTRRSPELRRVVAMAVRSLSHVIVSVLLGACALLWPPPGISGPTGPRRGWRPSSCSS